MTWCRAAHREKTPGVLAIAALLVASGCHGVPNPAGGDPGPGPDVPGTDGGPSSGNPAGTLDTSFGGNGTGIARVSFGADDQGSFTDLQVLGTSIVAAGTGYGGLGGSRFTIARLNETGTLDPSFAGGTLVRLGFAGSTASYAQAVAVAVQGTGSAVALGWHEQREQTGNIALGRWSSAGEPHDFPAGSGGKLEIDLGGTEAIRDGVGSQDDRLLLTGHKDGSLLVARLTTDGALDTSFAGSGFITLPWDAPASGAAIALDCNDRIVVAAEVGAEGARDLAVVRLLTDGSPDQDFGDSGRVLVASPGSDERAAAVSVDDAGRITVVGDGNSAGQRDYLVVRLQDNGTPDPGFGSAGLASIGTDADEFAEDVLVTTDGRVLIAGNTGTEFDARPLLARLTANGAPDPSFGAGGIVKPMLGEYARIERVREYPGGRAVIAGGDEGMSPGPGTYGIVARIWL
jgi:uncharacterized delta-60 repeat protein